VALAELILHEQGGPRDHEAARVLFARAAALGSAPAMFGLGAMYGGGHDIPTDRAEALRWFRAGAAQNHGLCALMLGRYLQAGIACQPDPAAARRAFQVALAAGVAEARAELDGLDAQAAAD